MARVDEEEEREDEGQAAEEKEEANRRRRGRNEEEERSHKYARNANKNPQRTRARGRYDLAACRYEHTNLSERSLRENGVLLLHPSMKYIGVCPRIRDAEDDSIRSRPRGFTREFLGAPEKSRSRTILRNKENQRDYSGTVNVTQTRRARLTILWLIVAM